MQRFLACILLLVMCLAGCAAPDRPGDAPATTPSPTASPTATLAAPASVPTTTPAETATRAQPSPTATATQPPRAPSPAPTAEPSPTPSPSPSPQPLAPRLPTPIPPIDIIIDNRDPGFSSTGHWFIGDGGRSHGGDCAWAPRGIGNIAYVEPSLPIAGAYEVYAWWCGDPNGDQAERAQIQVYPTRGRVATYLVSVNLQEDAGQWNSLGVFPLERNGFLSIDSTLHGNVVADAFRFVYRGPASAALTPTPRPTPVTWSNHPPSPLEQLTAGDLAARLGLTRRFYTASPLIASEEMTFDDCQAFPRDGCGGSRAGWRAQVRYQQLVVSYRVAKDYRHVAIEPPAGLADRQMLYLFGSKGTRFLRIDRYPDDTWMLSAAPLDADAPATSIPLEPQVVVDLRTFIDRYGTIRFTTNEGIQATLHGFGPRVELSEGDRAILSTLIEALAQMTWTSIP